MLTITPCPSKEAADLLGKLQGLKGVEEVVVLANDGVVYLKVDQHHFDERQLADFASPLVTA
jgi:hypothetical protein